MRYMTVSFFIAGLFALPYARVQWGMPKIGYPLIAGILLVYAIDRLFRKKKINTDIVIYLLVLCAFCAWLIFSSLWTVSTYFYQENIKHLLFFMVIGFSIAVVTNQRVQDYTILWIIFFALLAALGVFYGYWKKGDLSGSGMVLSKHYPVISMLVGFGAVSTIALWAKSESKTSRGIFGALSLLLYLAVGFSISRGALIASTLVGVLASIYMLVSKKRLFKAVDGKKRVAKKGVLSIGFILIHPLIAFVAAFSVGHSAGKLLRVFSGTELAVSGRGEWYRAAWANIREAPIIGYGLGSNGLMAGAAEKSYPHNFILQVWLDGGVVALAFLMLLLFLPVWSVYKNRKIDTHNYCWVAPAAIWLTCLLLYFKSSDFYTARPIIITGLFILSSFGGPGIFIRPSKVRKKQP